MLKVEPLELDSTNSKGSSNFWYFLINYFDNFMFKTYVLKNEQKIRYFFETAIILGTGVIESVNRFKYHIK